MHNDKSFDSFVKFSVCLLRTDKKNCLYRIFITLHNDRWSKYRKHLAGTMWFQSPYIYPVSQKQAICKIFMSNFLRNSRAKIIKNWLTFDRVIQKNMPSVLWRCWLGGRKGIRPVKNWVVGCWHGYLSGARCRLAYGPADATATHYLLLQ